MSDPWLEVKRNLPHHFIYETRCRVTGEFYRGKHSTDDLDDGYYGSGRWVKDGLRKYGKARFDRIILRECQFDELDQAEVELIQSALSDPKCRNIKRGGEGGRTRPGKVVVKRPGSRICFAVSVDDPRYKSGEFVHGTTGLVTVRDTKTGRCYSVTRDDPRYTSRRFAHVTKGFAWVNKNGDTKLVGPHELKQYLDSGWKRGRKALP